MSIIGCLPSRTLRRNIRIGTSVYSACNRRFYFRKIVKENDIVLLKHKTNSASVPVLTSPLRAGKIYNVELVRDSISHDAILGKAIRDVVVTRKGISYRVLQPTLAEYTDLSPRIVTPIYSQDANLIVSLLDLHPTVPDPNSPVGDRLEIFEAGTGHGALTLNLAKAIHGANTAPPKIEAGDEATETAQEVIQATRDAYIEWLKNRRAVIHSLDSSGRHSAHAQTVVKNFHHGIYYPHIDFHVGSIDSYLSSRLMETGDTPFLEHAILDLPNIHHHFVDVGKALKPNGSLITFCPSITQISSAVMFARQNNLPLFLEKVVEVGAAVGVGGREWDVRPVKPRALSKTKVEDMERPGQVEGTEDALQDAAEASQVITPKASVSEPPASKVNDSGWEMVCRPKVGLRISGGGFVGVWRKMTDTSA